MACGHRKVECCVNTSRTYFRRAAEAAVFSLLPSLRHLQGNEFIRDVFELGPPMLVDSATMKAMKISRFERVSVGTKRSRPRPTAPASNRLVFALPASSQLGCVQGPDQGQEQVQGQEGGCGRILTSSFVFVKLPFLTRPPAHRIDIVPPPSRPSSLRPEMLFPCVVLLTVTGGQSMT